ncbi:MAG: hypothetical protein P4L40_25480 [Terracidiphilus sp.]|nr:hypothetical protein [Terracidiphilus sp.]
MSHCVMCCACRVHPVSMYLRLSVCMYVCMSDPVSERVCLCVCVL